MNQFIPHDWQRLVGCVGPLDGYWHCSSTVGPRDAIRALQLRSLLTNYILWGKGRWVDHFLLYANNREADSSCTKVGGFPFLPRGDTWPLSRWSGLPLTFLAQFNFTESHNVIEGHLPANILLVFGERDLSDFQLLWASIDQGEAVQAAPDGTRILREYAGLRWRVENFPDAEPAYDNDWSRIEFSDGTISDDHPLVLCLLGVQIGHAPYIPPWRSFAELGGQPLATFCTVTPTLDEPYPFLDQEQPLHEWQDASDKFPAVDDVDWLSVVYIVRVEGDSFKVVTQNL